MREGERSKVKERSREWDNKTEGVKERHWEGGRVKQPKAKDDSNHFLLFLYFPVFDFTF